MKRFLTILISLTLLLAALGSLSACSGGVSRDEAKEATDAYFAAMAAARYEEAAALFHPATSMTAELMESTAETLRTEMGADFDEGVSIERYVGMTIRRVTLVKNCRNVVTYFSRGCDFCDSILDYKQETPCDCYYLRVELTDGRFGWTSPIWVEGAVSCGAYGTT